MPYNHMYYRHRVAPRVGAWIETCPTASIALTSKSLPVWERGLKHPQRRRVGHRRCRSPCGSVD